MFQNRKLQRIALVAVFLPALILLAGFAFRNVLLNRMLSDRIEKLETRTGMDISFQKAGFTGISTINIHQLCLLPPEGDTLMTMQRIRVNISPLALLTFRLKFGFAEINKPKLTLWREGSESNYLFLLNHGSDSVSSTAPDAQRRNYKAFTDRIFSLIFNYIPANIRITGLQASALINRHHLAFRMDDLLIDDRAFSTRIYVVEDSTVNQWNLGGLIQPSAGSAGFSLTTTGLSPVKIPYLQHRRGLLLAFDTLKLDLKYKKESDSCSRLTGNMRTSNQRINHARISPFDVILSSGSAEFSIKTGKTWVEIDSATRISFNGQDFRLFARYDQSPEKRIQIRINEPDFDAAVFFNALPDGLFTNLAGIRVKGRLGFSLHFDLNPDLPDSLTFNAALKQKGFSIQSFGATDFRRINGDFPYTAYEKGVPVRTFMVGPENPDFRRLDQIPDYLKYAIMTSEDGAFFHHNGFIPDAIRESIITNIREKRFARGGSTISMQLVKNVFLNRNKTITRKLEEMLITWLIESQRLTGKERMLEVYLNIIETGPMVYGVNEAARFYFAKDVSKLTLAESIYLASIVPRPKAFRYSFDSKGDLREHLKAYYELVSSKMLRKEWITQEDYDRLAPAVELKGPARELVVMTDTIPAGEIEEPEEF